MQKPMNVTHNIKNVKEKTKLNTGSYQLRQKKHLIKLHIFPQKKSLNKLGIEGNYHNIIKAIFEKSTMNILNGKRLKAFLLKSATRQKCLLSPPLFNVVLEVLVR